MTCDMNENQMPHGQRTAWRNPLNWPTGIWVLIAGSLVMSLPFMIRAAMLYGISDMPEPFDVAEFAKWDVPEEDNAFTDYRLAVEMKSKLGTIKIPWSVEQAMNSPWPESDEALSDDTLLEWIQVHRESLEVWRRGTAQQKAKYMSPLRMSSTTPLPVIQEQLNFALLAAIEVRRCLKKNELDEAFQWGRAILRAGGHTTFRGNLIQGIVGSALHEMAAISIQKWAEHPEVTSAQLMSALATIRQDELLYESASNILKAEYLSVQNTLTSGEWRETPSPSGGPKSGFTSAAMHFAMWVMGEPDVTRRLYRQMVANYLREIDKPISRRTERVASSELNLFETDPAVPLLPGQMNPREIDLQSKRSFMVKQLLPVTKNIDIDEVILRRRVRQSALETLLAVKAYQHDNCEFPDEIADITPKYLDRIPQDDFHQMGGTLRYFRDPCQRAAVWSVGPDGIDEQGRVLAALPPNFASEKTRLSDFIRRKAQSPDVGFWFR